MIRRTLEIVGSSFLMAIQELWKNKLRTFLSLLGVTFGIFCIISVLATVNSLEQNIQNEVKALGTNTIYIDKWDYSGGPDQPIWKFRARPTMKYDETGIIKQKSQLQGGVAYLMQTGTSISYKDYVIQTAGVYGIIEDQIEIQPLKFEQGRYFSTNEFIGGANICIIGFANAEIRLIIINQSVSLWVKDHISENF